MDIYIILFAIFIFYLYFTRTTINTNNVTEQPSNLKDDLHILPEIIHDDSLYDDRDFSDKDRENRLSKLIFG